MEKNLIRSWDYRWKLVSLTLLIFSITSTTKLFAMFAALSLSIILLILSGMTITGAVKSLKPPFILLLIMAPFIIFTPGKDLMFQWSFLKIYTEGFILLLTITLKSSSIILIFTVLLYKANLARLMHAMNAIGIPGKLVSIFISTYRYIYLYLDDLGKLYTAARLRGFSVKKGFSHILTSADILLTLLIRSYEQSERVQAAMIMRGYKGDFHNRETFSSKSSDRILSLSILLCCVIIISLEFLC